MKRAPEKKSLLTTNKYLKDPQARKRMIHQAALSSTSIEGVHIQKRKNLFSSKDN